MIMTIQELQQFIEKSWAFDANTYPLLGELNGDDRLNFSRRHLMMHLQKEVGDLVRILEPLDHGKPPPEDYRDRIRKILRDLQIVTLRLNALEERGEKDLVESVQELYKK